MIIVRNRERAQSALRGRTLARSSILGILVLLMCAAAGAAGCGRTPVRAETFVMNTILTQTVYGSEEICAGNERIARELENMLSRTIETSEVWQISHSEEAVEVDERTMVLLATALEQFEATGGAFDPALGAFRDLWGFGTDDPQVPSEAALEELLARPGAADISAEEGAVSAGGADIDLGAAAKGFALDEMRTYMEENGVKDALVSFGGAILALGGKEDGSPWKIGIRDPFSEDASAYIAVMEASDICIQTSGISEQYFVENGTLYHHILDPATGRPAQTGLAAVVVAAQSGTLADIWATALFVMGPEDGLAFCEENGIAALFLTEDKRMLRSSEFTFELEDVEEGYVPA